MWCPQEVPLKAPPSDDFFLIYLVLVNGLVMHYMVKDDSI
jgi:hypothetical protein